MNKETIELKFSYYIPEFQEYLKRRQQRHV